MSLLHEEPFVILWRARTATDPRVARTCFERIRVHHPNALVCVFRDGNVDLSYVDERCWMVRELCSDDMSAWQYFFTNDRSWGAGLLLHDNIFVGSRPFPPFLQNQFLWLDNPDRPDVSFRLEPSGQVVTFAKPLGLMGYFRKSFCRQIGGRVPTDPNAFTFEAVRRGVGFMFRHEPCEVKRCLDALVQADVPVYCRIE